LDPKVDGKLETIDLELEECSDEVPDKLKVEDFPRHLYSPCTNRLLSSLEL
jgi:hypothetical protein